MAILLRSATQVLPPSDTSRDRSRSAAASRLSLRHRHKSVRAKELFYRCEDFAHDLYLLVDFILPIHKHSVYRPQPCLALDALTRTTRVARVDRSFVVAHPPAASDD